MFGIAEKENEMNCNAVDNDIERQLKQCKMAQGLYNSSKNQVKLNGQRHSVFVRGLSGSTNSETVKDSDLNRRQITLKLMGGKFDHSELDQQLLGNPEVSSAVSIN